ncbi:MAG: DASS family sodium-coupled anion symporter [Gammaproteobacteria bacterium]|nr:DASS family sodium-coupled anion symporter [Gammaproteobacteria bacterium]
MITRARVSAIGLWLGPALAVVVFVLLPDADPAAAAGLGLAGRITAALAAWMATWWLTEAVPLAATALLPVVVLPLAEVSTLAAATAPYANALIFLFLGGFIIGLAIQRFGLHRRMALHILLVVGTSPRRLIAGFMLASALLSMWISNTATAIMMLPIGASILTMLNERQRDANGAAGSACQPAETAPFATALVLGIAYACSIGGIGTLIGTPPNLILAAFLRSQYGIELSMARWLTIGLPLVAILLPLTWFYLTRIAFRVSDRPLPCGRDVIRAELAALGPMGRGERVVLGVFLATATAWILRPQISAWSGLAGLSDATIAMLGALILFVIPVSRSPRTAAMDWGTARHVPWEILILFGGGLSLAGAIAATGVDAFIGSGFAQLAGVAPVVIVLAITAGVILLTEITSNTAVTTTLMPVLAATAVATGAPPGMLLTAAAMAASCAFMLPVATPPNAIVFASGYVNVAQMARAGLWLNLMAALVITLIVYLGVRLVIAG